jgi:hypothetical protein
MSTFEQNLRSLISDSVASMRTDDADISSLDSRRIVDCILASASNTVDVYDIRTDSISTIYNHHHIVRG